MRILRFICSMFSHKFGFRSDKCVICGIDMVNDDWSKEGAIISSEYDK